MRAIWDQKHKWSVILTWAFKYAYSQNLVPYLISQMPNIQYRVFWSHQSSTLRKELEKKPIQTREIQHVWLFCISQLLSPTSDFSSSLTHHTPAKGALPSSSIHQASTHSQHIHKVTEDTAWKDISTSYLSDLLCHVVSPVNELARCNDVHLSSWKGNEWVRLKIHKI